MVRDFYIFSKFFTISQESSRFLNTSMRFFRVFNEFLEVSQSFKISKFRDFHISKFQGPRFLKISQDFPEFLKISQHFLTFPGFEISQKLFEAFKRFLETSQKFLTICQNSLKFTSYEISHNSLEIFPKIPRDLQISQDFSNFRMVCQVCSRLL